MAEASTRVSPVSVGEMIPDVIVQVIDDDGMPESVSTRELLGKGTVVLFAVPGAFTPGCSKIHLPSFINGMDEMKAKGVETVACISVNDPWVMEAWRQATGADGILMVADGNGDFALAMDLVLNGTGFGLGMRSQRYAAVIRDGVVHALNVEAGTGISASACPAILKAL